MGDQGRAAAGEQTVRGHANASDYNWHLEIDGLACARGTACLFEGLSVALAPGEALAVRGPNGAGKTTLLRTLGGFAPALEGRILCGPAGALSEDTGARREAVAYLGHGDGLKGAMSAAETVAFWARLFGGRTEGVLDTVRLADRADLPVRALSAGQRRRLALARLLVCRRPVWLLDEPAVSLDDRSIGLLERLIADHRARGGIAVVALHGGLALPDALIARIGGEAAA